MKLLYPDPRQRRPRFELPGSAGAGPQQLGMTGGRWGEGTNSLEGVVGKKILQEEPVIITPIDLFYHGPHNCDCPGIK